MHVKKGDVVTVISGNDKGRTGEVKQALPRRQRVVVEGVNMRWNHKKPTQQNPKGERVQAEAPIHVSNVKLAGGATGAKPAAKKAAAKKPAAKKAKALKKAE